ncbi:MAG: SDR family oxidoreductase [Candidatus Abyssobacteria bacterium SURF_17]|uniref:SDR family oxidoreductase n=1 Tax=Candidatus Abyssobacteria bacterium SURF_17 TaxID=2093361 RepID=A0A419F9Y1_9BACT|nr:MAG: SDR family oxidoreductase [Candidatus Abyssubacteria bacterium SURF_17]
MAEDRFSLKGKVALITGGSRGIGRAIALEFAKAGADIVVASRKLDACKTAAEEIERLGRRALAVSAHTGKSEQLEHLVDEALRCFGKIDILVNNAATNPHFGATIDIERAAWDKTFEVNVDGVFFLTQIVFNKWMRDHGGVIINMASVAAFCPTPMTGAYCVTKAALIMLTEVLATELGVYNIRVNAIAPGFIRTDMSKAVWTSDLFKERSKAFPIPRVGETEDLVGAALYLASDASAFVTGETMVVDGGARHIT